MRTSPSADNLKEVYQGLDRAAKKKYIHRKKADRLKSRLARLLANHNKEKQPVKKTAKLKPKTSKKTSK